MRPIGDELVTGSAADVGDGTILRRHRSRQRQPVEEVCVEFLTTDGIPVVEFGDGVVVGAHGGSGQQSEGGKVEHLAKVDQEQLEVLERFHPL